MTETSTTITNTAADIVSAATQLDPMTAPRAQVSINWHSCDEDALRTIMAAFPDARWQPQQSGTTEWISGRVGPVQLTAFAADPEPRPASRLDALFPAVQA